MEPLSALSVATAVTQFLDFTGAVLSSTWKIYISNDDDFGPNPDIVTITKNLNELNGNLRHSSSCSHHSSPTKQDQDIERLCGRCVELGDRLITVLNSLQSQSKHRLWGSFRQALGTIWNQTEIDSLQQTLANYRQQITMYLLVHLREQTSEAQKDLNQTHSLCQKILNQVTANVQWQDDIMEAIKRSHEQDSTAGPSNVVPNRLHRSLTMRAVESIENCLLQFLRFEELARRYDQISSPHTNTFEWIYHHPSEVTKWADFYQWLEQEDSLYWITGKAGAGKSTLMRFVSDNNATKSALQTWAAKKRLITGSFFFWNSGTTVQMSSEGLIRTLLFQILKELPHLIPLVFPQRVEMGIIFGYSAITRSAWTWHELLRSFRMLIQKATETAKLVFFIDGMDEYQGKPSEIIDLVASMVTPGVKICASSRPWNEFKDAFTSQPNLRLEDLTYPDIKTYVSSKLGNQRGFQELQELDEQLASQIIENVCGKSSGVFLWVVLVTQSLVRGVSDGERLSDLQKRLDSLPSDLELLFQKIFDSLSANHMERASQLFQIIRASINPMNLLQLYLADEDDPDIVMKMPYRLLSLDEANTRAKIMHRRMNAYCKGLLEASREPKSKYSSSNINYLHRTVKDFLHREDTWAQICGKAENFNPNVRLYNCQIIQIKLLDPDHLKVDEIMDFVTYGMEYAIRADPDGGSYQISSLNIIDRVVNDGVIPHIRGGKASWRWVVKGAASENAHTFLEFAVRCGLEGYVRHTLVVMPKSREKDCLSSILHSALYQINHGRSNTGSSVRPIFATRPSLKYGIYLNRAMVKTLLDLGAVPDFSPGPAVETSWGIMLGLHWDACKERLPWAEDSGILDEFLLHGADPWHNLLGHYMEHKTDFTELVHRKRQEVKVVKVVKKPRSWFQSLKRKTYKYADPEAGSKASRITQLGRLVGYPPTGASSHYGYSAPAIAQMENEYDLSGAEV